MKLGFGLYRHLLNRESYRFARQLGATYVVVHLVDYFRGNPQNNPHNQPTGGLKGGWGYAGDPHRLWTAEELTSLRREIESEGLILEAIENFDPAHCHDILLDGPQRALHVENVKTILRNLGAAGIPLMGYNFSLAGVAGRTTGPYARGQALSVGMEGPVDDPMPLGMVWNMVFDAEAPEGVQPSATPEQLWSRVQRFLEEVIPVAEQAGVRLAAHPDDPPLPTVRGQPRLVFQPDHYQRLIDLHPSPANALEFCVGSIAEMTEGDVYAAVDRYSRQQRIGYVHLRNVRGKVPEYQETFIDEGEVDIRRVLAILQRNGFAGVIIPDHAPQVECAAPWHAGMAFAMGYLKAGLDDLARAAKNPVPE